MIPSARERKRRACWFHASSVTKYVIVRSRVGWFAGHWSARGNRSARCAGSECPICASGAEAEIFTYVFVETEHGDVLAWQIPERLRDLARELEASTFEGPGCQLAIAREGVHRNSRVTAVITGFEHVEELDIEPFVRTLGHPSAREALLSNHA